MNGIRGKKNYAKTWMSFYKQIELPNPLNWYLNFNMDWEILTLRYRVEMNSYYVVIQDFCLNVSWVVWWCSICHWGLHRSKPFLNYVQCSFQSMTSLLSLNWDVLGCHFGKVLKNAALSTNNSIFLNKRQSAPWCSVKLIFV